MRKNLFLYTLLMVGMMSCNLDSRLLGNKNKKEGKEISGNKEGIKDSEKKVASVSGMQGDESARDKDVVVNDEAKEDKNVSEKEKLVSQLQKDAGDVMVLVKKYKGEEEDKEQYGMKDKVFKAVTDDLTKKTLDDDGNKEARRLFYSSLDYDKDKLKEFAEILKKIESDGEKKGTWIKDIINAGREHIQSNFEKVVNKLEESKAKLAELSLDDLKEVQTKFEEIKSQREAFKVAVNSLLEAYKAKKDGIDSDSKKLIAHVEKEYKELITVKIPGMKKVSEDLLNKIK